MRGKKLLLVLFVSILVLSLGLLLVGCNAEGKEVKLKEISGFEKLMSEPSSIKVTFDDEYVGEFVIVDEEQINTIYEMLIDRSYIQRRKEEVKPPGKNRCLTFIYTDSTQISFDASWVYTANGQIYSPKTSDKSLDEYLEEIGLSLNEIVPR